MASAQDMDETQTTAFSFSVPWASDEARLLSDDGDVTTFSIRGLAASAYTNHCTEPGCWQGEPNSSIPYSGFNQTYAFSVNNGYRITGYKITGSVSSSTSGEVLSDGPPAANTTMLVTISAISNDGQSTYATGSAGMAHSLDGDHEEDLLISNSGLSLTGQFSILFAAQATASVTPSGYSTSFLYCRYEYYCYTITQHTMGATSALIVLPSIVLTVYSEQIAAVPEPATYAMLLAGLMVSGAATRRRRDV